MKFVVFVLCFSCLTVALDLWLVLLLLLAFIVSGSSVDLLCGLDCGFTLALLLLVALTGLFAVGYDLDVCILRCVYFICYL